MSQERTYGVAMLGFGFIGKVHGYALRNLPLFYDPPPVRTRLVAVATSRRETAEKARELMDFEVASDDQLAVIDRPDVDIVHVCTPNHLHAPALLAAMKANKHIYCEKPLVADASEAEQIAVALPGYRGISQMALPYRFWPATLRAKQMVEQGRIGTVSHFRAAYLHAGSIERNKPLNWKADAEQGGGVINDLLSHVLDLMWHLLGPLEPTYAVSRVWNEQRQSLSQPGKTIARVGEDFVLAAVRTADGAPGVIEASKIATGAEDELRFEIHGERGALRFNLMEPNWLDFCDMADADYPLGGGRGWKRIATVARYEKPGGFPGPKQAIGWLRGQMHSIYHFLDAVANQRAASPDLSHGIQLQRVLGQIANLCHQNVHR